MTFEIELTYISPEGNPEIWLQGTQPEGYVTEEEWEESHKPTVEVLKATKIAEIIGEFRTMFAPINAVYPPEEQSSWPEQEADAALYMAWFECGKQGPEPEPELKILPQILLPGEKLEDLCASVVAKGAFFKALRNTLQAQQRAHYHAVLALQSEKEIKDYVVTYTLPPELAAYLGGENA